MKLTIKIDLDLSAPLDPRAKALLDLLARPPAPPPPATPTLWQDPEEGTRQ